MAIRVSEVKSSRLSDDNKEVIVDSMGKYTGALELRFARECPDEVRFEIPKNFTVTADTSGRGLVLFILNHRLENQRGYALSPDAAKQVAGGLVKSADASLALKQSATPTN